MVAILARAITLKHRILNFEVVYIYIYIYHIGDRGSTAVKVLYKLEGRWFDPSWCQWIFH